MADQKKDEQNSTDAAVERAVFKALETALPLAAKMSAEAQVRAQPRQATRRVPTGGQCPACRQAQYVDHNGVVFACGEKHIKMSVYPSFNDKWFQGVSVNGVTYRSNFAGHLITVPAENEIQKTVENWEKQERESAQGRQIRPQNYSVLSRPPPAGSGQG